MAGLHDIDQGWMRVRRPISISAAPEERVWPPHHLPRVHFFAQAVRSVCGTDEGVCPRIVPRLMWEATSLSAEEHKRSIDLIAQVVDEHGFDGIVLERPLARPVFRWAELLANRLHALRTPPPLDPALRFHATKHLVVVAPPTLRGRDGSVVRGLAPADFVAVMKFADRLSLMTYDFSSSRGVVGPNAPLEWVRESASSLLSTVTDPNERRALAAKVLVGLAMYGYVTPKRWGPRGASSSTPPRSLDRSLDRSHTHSQPRQRRGDPGEHVNRAAAGAPTDAATGREGGGALLRLQGSERRGAPGVLPDAVLRPGPSGRREGAGHGGVGVGDRTGSARVVRPLLRRASGLRLVGDTHSEIAHDETPRRHTPDTHRVQHLTVALAAQSPGPRDSGPPRTREDRPTTPESGSSS